MALRKLMNDFLEVAKPHVTQAVQSAAAASPWEAQTSWGGEGGVDSTYWINRETGEMLTSDPHKKGGPAYVASTFDPNGTPSTKNWTPTAPMDDGAAGFQDPVTGEIAGFDGGAAIRVWNETPGSVNDKLNAVARFSGAGSEIVPWTVRMRLASPEQLQQTQLVQNLAARGYPMRADGQFEDHNNGGWEEMVRHLSTVPIAAASAGVGGAVAGGTGSAIIGGAAGGATFGGSQALVQGNNVVEGALRGGVAGAVAGGISDVAGLGDPATGDFGSFDPGGEFGGLPDAGMDLGGFADGSITDLGDSFAEEFFAGDFGAPAQAEKFLLADSGRTVSDVTPGLLENEASPIWQAEQVGIENMPPARHQEGAFDASPRVGGGTEFTPAAAPAESTGLLQSTFDFAKDNPVLTIAGASLAGNVLTNVAAAKRDEARMAHENQLEEEKLEDRRRFVQGGSYYDARVKLKPGQSRVLRRPDGTPVYTTGGLINSRVQ